MKRIFFAMMAVVLVSTAGAQDKNLYWTMRVKVKMDKKAEWEKKAPILLKTHYPQFDFRVYEIATGPNTGSYMLAIGPISYKDMDAPPVFPKGELAARNDALALDAISEAVEVNHYVMDSATSRPKEGREYKYARLTFVEISLGAWSETQGFLRKLKEVGDKNDFKNDHRIFRPSVSGAVNRFVIVGRLEKWEEIDQSNDPGQLYDNLHGPNSWYIDRTKYLSAVTSMVSEIWVLRRDLSTRKSI